MTRKRSPLGNHVFHLAEEKSREFGHGVVGTEHILLALMLVKDSIAARALSQQGVSVEEVEEKVVVSHGSQSTRPASTHHRSSTNRCQRVYKAARKEAQYYGLKEIGTAELLLGIILEDEGMAVSILAELNISLEDLAMTIFREAYVDAHDSEQIRLKSLFVPTE